MPSEETACGHRHGLSPLGTGVVFLPMMLGGLMLTPIVPMVVERVGVRRVVVTGLALMTLGLVALALVPAPALHVTEGVGLVVDREGTVIRMCAGGSASVRPSERSP